MSRSDGVVVLGCDGATYQFGKSRGNNDHVLFVLYFELISMFARSSFYDSATVPFTGSSPPPCPVAPPLSNPMLL